MSAARLKQSGKEGGRSNTRQRLLDAAREVFSERGIECATTRGIAERAGCNEVTLFRHFESKQKLLAAVVRETTEEFRELCDSPASLCGDLREDLKCYARIYNASLERCEGMARALIGEGKRQPNLARELVGDVLEPFHRSLAQYLRGRMETGHVREDVNAEAFAELFTATLMGGLLRRTSGLSALDRDGWLHEAVESAARAVESEPLVLDC